MRFFRFLVFWRGFLGGGSFFFPEILGKCDGEGEDDHPGTQNLSGGDGADRAVGFADEFDGKSQDSVPGEENCGQKSGKFPASSAEKFDEDDGEDEVFCRFVELARVAEEVVDVRENHPPRLVGGDSDEFAVPEIGEASENQGDCEGDDEGVEPVPERDAGFFCEKCGGEDGGDDSAVD